MRFDLFMCYCSSDAQLAKSLKEALDRAGVSVWHAGTEIHPGDSIVAKLQEGIARSTHGLIVFTPGFLSDVPDYRWLELQTYLARRSTDNTKIVPLAIGVDPSNCWNRVPFLQSVRFESVESGLKSDAQHAEVLRVAQTISEMVTLRSRVRLASRGDLESEFGDLEERLTSVKSHLKISGNDCAGLFPGKLAFIRQALRDGVRIDVMCVDPTVQSAVEHLVRIDPVFESESDFIRSMTSIEPILRNLRTQFPNLFSFRYTPVAPAIGLFISDPGLPAARIKVEMYTPKPWRPVRTRPHVILNNDTMWVEYFLNSWDNYWNMSRIPA